MKRIPIFIFVLCLILCPLQSVLHKSSALDVGQAYVITSKCDLYTLPDFTSDKVLDKNGEKVSLKHKEKVNILSFEGDFALIESGQTQGYVYKFYLTDNPSPTVYPVFNATIRKDCPVLDGNFEDSGLTLKKKTRVFIYEGYSSKKDYHAIQFVLDDGSLYNGYVEKQYINPDGISSVLIIGITIIVSAVTIILSLIFIKKKKK